MDVEFTTLSQALDIAADFQEVLKAYKSFVSNLMRLAMVDNLTIQECFERIFQVMSILLKFLFEFFNLRTQDLPEIYRGEPPSK